MNDRGQNIIVAEKYIFHAGCALRKLIVNETQLSVI